MKTAFNGDPKTKEKYVARVKKHYDADEIIQGTYWENGKGCAVGCTMERNNTGTPIHQRMENEIGVPRMVARLEDRIFEGLTNGDAKKFPLRFLKAINPGADLSMVAPKFFVWLLTNPTDGIIKFAREDGKKAIQAVADLYKEKIAGKTITEVQWRSADAAADAAAAYAAAAYAADAADAAAYAADAAADAAAAYAADWGLAKTKHFKKMADKLIEIISVTK
jgi:hypothetical protein